MELLLGGFFIVKSQLLYCDFGWGIMRALWILCLGPRLEQASVSEGPNAKNKSSSVKESSDKNTLMRSQTRENPKKHDYLGTNPKANAKPNKREPEG
jgi:hypothetical protein